MAAYLINRVLLALVTIVFISVLSFVIIHLPPGDYVDAYIAQLASSGAIVSAQEAANLRVQYGLDQPLYIQYLRWIGMIFQGNFGMAMEYNRPVLEVIGDRAANAHHARQPARRKTQTLRRGGPCARRA